MLCRLELEEEETPADVPASSLKTLFRRLGDESEAREAGAPETAESSVVDGFIGVVGGGVSWKRSQISVISEFLSTCY